jgi:hypothetical protein
MRLAALGFKLHRWLAYALGLQVLAWVIGGTVFALLPSQPWVKGAASVSAPKPVFAAIALARELARENGELAQIEVFQGPLGAAVKLVDAQGMRWRLLADGSTPRISADAIAAFALTVYRGDGTLRATSQGPVARRFGIVAEVGVRKDLWRVEFDDALSTRLYFDGRSGEFLFVRNDAWMLYDFFWRLHIMDYSEGENFNHPLLQFAAIGALCLALTGSLLAVLALRRAWVRRGARH